ncbi:MAG: signal peptidase I [Bacilli bacterium]|nr:signal peptidase I [Bacilli bacterium]
MKTSVKKCLLIEILLGISALLNFIFPVIFNHDRQIIFLAIALLITFFSLGIDLKRNANDKNVIRNILIYIFIYYIIIYLAGLFIGFARTIYSYTFSNLINNILPTLFTIVLMELIRHELINKTNKNKLVLITSCILFILFESSYSFGAYNMAVKEEVYKYIGLVVIASISKNILMTVLNTRTDAYPGILYRIIMEELIYVVIIVPNLGPYLESVALIILPVLISFMVINTEKKKVVDKPKDRKKLNKFYLVVTVILLMLVLLNSGLLKYQIMVIGSNSMYPYMEKGDVIFLERMKNDELKEIKKGDILVFRYDNKIINHRVTKVVERSGQLYFTTKGDNNNQEDNTVTKQEDVIGITLHRIKYIGLPSIWLSEVFD